MRVVMSSLLLAACSDASPAPSIDAHTVDAFDAEHCGLAADYGMIADVIVGQSGAAGDLQHIALTGVLDAGPPRDDIEFTIRTLATEGTSYFIPSTDVRAAIRADVSESGPRRYYVADTGSARWMHVSVSYQLMAMDLRFVEANATGVVVPGGCKVLIKSVALRTN
jgi:hypothetical protein